MGFTTYVTPRGTLRSWPEEAFMLCLHGLPRREAVTSLLTRRQKKGVRNIKEEMKDSAKVVVSLVGYSKLQNP